MRYATTLSLLVLGCFAAITLAACTDPHPPIGPTDVNAAAAAPLTDAGVTDAAPTPAH